MMGGERRGGERKGGRELYVCMSVISWAISNGVWEGENLYL